jgi:4-hydroxy-tetrahydrodipicolinate synthase
VWLPLVTPFLDGAVDLASHAGLVEHYVRAGVQGLVLLGTTGESPTVTEDGAEALIEQTLDVAAGRVPVVVGVSGNDTRKVAAAVRRVRAITAPAPAEVAP